MSIFSYFVNKRYEIMEKEEAPLVTQEQIESIKKRLWELENPPKFKVLDRVLWDHGSYQANRGYETSNRGHETSNLGSFIVTILNVKVEGPSVGGYRRVYKFTITDDTLEERLNNAQSSRNTWLLNDAEINRDEKYLKPLKSG